MPARCLNNVLLIGNLTRDPELRYTPSGNAVCTFGMATNRYWTTETGERREEAQFFRIVAWNKLAEICSQLLGKGDKVYVEGRIQSRKWTGADGVQRERWEIILSDMILLRSQRGREEAAVPEEIAKEPPPEEVEAALEVQAPPEEEKKEEKEEKKEEKKEGEEKKGEKKEEQKEEVEDEKMPF